MLGEIAISTALFRIPYRTYQYRFVVSSFVVSVIATVTYNIIETPIWFNEILMESVLFYLHIFFLKISMWHSFIMTSVGYLLSNIVLWASGSLGYLMGLFSLESMIHSDTVLYIIQFISFAILFLVSSFLFKQGIGFMFISNKMNSKVSLRWLNIMIISAISMSIIASILTMYLMNYNYDYSYYLAAICIVILNLALWGMYLRSNRELEEKYRNININNYLN